MKRSYAFAAVPTVSRRTFVRFAAASGATLALAACAPPAYPARVRATWEQPLKKETNMGDQLREIVRYATLAPSGHNTQPWKFAVAENTIRIFPDYDRQLPVVDPEHRELFISLGCALENLVVAAAGAGYAADVACFPADEPECLRVTLSPGPVGTGGPGGRHRRPAMHALVSTMAGRSLPPIWRDWRRVR